ncbi:MAG: ATP-binding protein [Polaribacter sp.]|nr:ATP-binding protein [Polaribacter sp.]
MEKIIQSKLNKGKAIIIYGARQVGKTTLLKKIFKKDSKEIYWLNGDRVEDRALLENASSTRLLSFLSGKKMIIIDEAQRIEDIGLKLKIIFDETPIQIVATGSSSFDLANKIQEPMTGRKYEYKLYPFSFDELAQHSNTFEEYKQLPNRLLFGSYPDVVLHEGNQREVLENLANSYLYKDILEWGKIKKSAKILKLLQAIAFQIGSQVSYTELSRIVGINKETVENYIDLLEKSFVIFRLHSFSRNLRNELKKSKKIYFYDNGIRNALINNFNPIELRNDVGALWENYIISERIKYTDHHQIYANRYFWRTRYQQEIDYIEEREGKLFAYEFKWNTHKKVKIPNSFMNAYPDTKTKIITPANYHEFITRL